MQWHGELESSVADYNTKSYAIKWEGKLRQAEKFEILDLSDT